MDMMRTRTQGTDRPQPAQTPNEATVTALTTPPTRLTFGGEPFAFIQTCKLLITNMEITIFRSLSMISLLSEEVVVS